MKDFNALELIGLFEDVNDLDEDIKVHKDAIKAIGLNITSKFKNCSEENDVPAKKLRSAYKYYLSKLSGDSDKDEEDPLYNLMMKVDMGLEADAKKKG